MTRPLSCQWNSTTPPPWVGTEHPREPGRAYEELDVLLLEDVGSGPEGVVDDPVVDRSEQLVRRFEQGEVPRVAGED